MASSPFHSTTFFLVDSAAKSRTNRPDQFNNSFLDLILKFGYVWGLLAMSGREEAELV